MRKESGFSLVEVLVAFAILALALVAIFRSYGLAARSEAEAVRERAALDLARELIAAGTDAPKAGADSGAEGPLRWQRDIARWRRQEPQTMALYRVAVTVEWGERQIVLSTLALGGDASP